MSLTDKIGAAKTEATAALEFIGEEIITVDAEKEQWDAAIKLVDEDTTAEIEALNTAINDVGQAYQDRIVSGCATDMVWRLVGLSTNMGGDTQYELEVTKLSIVGYATTGSTGPNTCFTVITNAGTISSSTADSKYGFIEDNYHGIKTWIEPGTKDIGDTTVGSFIGTVGAATTILTMMLPLSSELQEDFVVGQLVTSDKNGIFAGASNRNTIVGFGTTTVDLYAAGITTINTGVGATQVRTLILEDSVTGFASLPPAGPFVEFTVLDDPTGISTYTDYQVDQAANPFSPQTIQMMGSGPLGVGTFVKYDNSGISSVPQSWKPEYGTESLGDIPAAFRVIEPSVGAGKSYYREGFSVHVGSYDEGDTRTVESLASLYSALPSCSSAVSTALTSALSTRDTKESAFASGFSDFQADLDAVNALRYEKVNEYDLRIWSLRQAIGFQVASVARYNSLQDYVDKYPNKFS